MKSIHYYLFHQIFSCNHNMRSLVLRLRATGRGQNYENADCCTRRDKIPVPSELSFVVTVGSPDRSRQLHFSISRYLLGFGRFQKDTRRGSASLTRASMHITLSVHSHRSFPTAPVCASLSLPRLGVLISALRWSLHSSKLIWAIEDWHVIEMQSFVVVWFQLSAHTGQEHGVWSRG